MVATLRQHKRAGPYILFESSHIPFSPFSVSYLASPPSSEWIQPSGCWQAALFFSFKGNVLRDLDRLLFSLTSDEGGMAAGRGNCSSEIVSRMCGGQTRLCSPMLELVQNIAGKKTDAMCLICFNNQDILFSTEVFVFPKLAAVPLRPSAVIQVRRLHRADSCVECPRGTEAHSSCDGWH